VLLIGNRAVGKSCLYEVLKNPAYEIGDIKKMTVGIHPTNQWFEYNYSCVKMKIVDTAAEERFFAVTSSYYHDVNGVFLVYDVSDEGTLKHLPFWINEINKYTTSRDEVQMLLVGNKVDLRQNMESEELKEMVPQEKALAFADKFGFPYVETSAKDIDSVMMMYKKMIEILIGEVRVEDVDIQVRKEAKSTIKLPSSPFKQRVLNKVNCPSCKNS
jgi:small GTP-binding protein